MIERIGNRRSMHLLTRSSKSDLLLPAYPCLTEDCGSHAQIEQHSIVC
jgi:hypothetical protein